MSAPQMDVLYLQTYLQQSYGHVLAIFTRNAQPAQIEATSDAFVGDGLRLRMPSADSSPNAPDIADVVIPATLIGLFSAGFDHTALARPLDYTAIPTTSVPNAVQAFSGAAITMTLSPLFTITVPAGASGSILILFETSEASPISTTVTIPAVGGTVPLTFPTALVSGKNYRAVIFVPGSPMVVSASFTAP